MMTHSDISTEIFCFYSKWENRKDRKRSVINIYTLRMKL